MQVTPVIDDVDEAREWFEVLPAAIGVEGLVVKGAATRYLPGRRDAWVKVNSARVARVRFAVASGVRPGQRVVRRNVVVCDGCRGRAVT